MSRTLALVDGEHHPAVVRAALERAGQETDVVAVLLLGGGEKLDGVPDYGLPLERVAGDPGAAVVSAARGHGADRVLDLSDEPVLSEAGRFWLVNHALAAGLSYHGPDFDFRPPARAPVAAAALAVVGTGKRIGKTAVSAHTARLVAASGRRVVVVAMGRGGPAEPTPVDPTAAALGAHELLLRARAGQHAASDYLEDAVLAGVPTVGARRCGGGLAGATYDSNVLAAAELAASGRPDLLLLEGSGAAIPPVAAGRTLLVTSGVRPSHELMTGMGPFRVLVSDMVVLTMCEPPLASAEQVEQVRAAVLALKPDVPVIATVLDPVPAEDVSGARVAYFTTAPTAIHDRLRSSLRREAGADVSAVVGSLSNRAALRQALELPEVLGADVFLVEIKAAAIDVVAEAAQARGKRVVFCDNRPRSLAGEPGLDAALLGLADEAVSAYA